MVNYDFDYGKLEADMLLKGSDLEIFGTDTIAGVKIRFNDPWLIARGRNSLVFKLPKSGLVAKSSFYATIPPEKDPDQKGYYRLVGYRSGLEPIHENNLEVTIENLREMGFGSREGISLPEMHEHTCKVNMFNERRLHYTLMPDLREGGTYRVIESEEFPFGTHPLGNTLQELYERSCRELLEVCTTGAYKVICAGHGSEENPEPAIRHMFLVQTTDTDARLCLADLNHLIIHKRIE